MGNDVYGFTAAAAAAATATTRWHTHPTCVRVLNFYSCRNNVIIIDSIPYAASTLFELSYGCVDRLHTELTGVCSACIYNINYSLNEIKLHFTEDDLPFISFAKLRRTQAKATLNGASDTKRTKAKQLF